MKVCERNVFIFHDKKRADLFVIQNKTEIKNASLLDQLIRYY